MLQSLNARIAKSREEGGFTLIELLVVIIIIGILLAIAVPSYMKFRDRANKSAAQANVRSAIPAVEAYAADNGGYTGMTLSGAGGLQSIDAGVKNVQVVGTPGANTYCIQNDDNTGYTYSKDGPQAGGKQSSRSGGKPSQIFYSEFPESLTRAASRRLRFCD